MTKKLLTLLLTIGIITNQGVSFADEDKNLEESQGIYRITGTSENYEVAVPNEKEEKDFDIIMDDVSKGYVLVKGNSEKRLKVQIIQENTGKTYNYDLRKDGKYEIFPIQSGDGKYQVKVMENTKNDYYTPKHTEEADLDIEDLSPFLSPNQFIMYSSKWNIYKKTKEITKGLKTDAEKIAAIYHYSSKLKYDDQKANEIRAGKHIGYIPNIDKTLKSQKGICMDYAAVMTAMLRIEKIPARSVYGKTTFVDEQHAWVEVYSTTDARLSGIMLKKGWNVFDPTAANKDSAPDVKLKINKTENYIPERMY